ncbi:phosphoribosylformylglycinamidine synthase subunit PurL [Halothermothrix orenii]|uniref:Phosphoribosylformylglycinamidine synthase subunit PurL n=1 Tax=Halothermothrix orenii (strain H 168 / OCM 544 / DSM 9562) TaxID=373903 RepID=B8D0M2_HALOH|nr:phosphoribosylformylglycinamidine synthase subunit PurL [Halothermothrix orenii]ACL70958.1 phosphoribosylformylglycinamidine synthase II [Halothermothrix orenii H 168]
MKSREQLLEKLKFHGLTEKEYHMIVEKLGREPNELELGLFGVMWSEHCGYKNSKAVLRNFPTEGEQVLQGPGENAGIVDIGDNKAVVFKIESHNHPSAIEPYQGAATGVGGIIRDIFTMGARPIALLDSLRFGPLDEERVRYIFSGVVSGISDYGNSIGIPTVGGETYFHKAYKGNPLVNAMCVGLVDHKDIIKAVARGVGNPVMVVGATTGRDGIQGASFASEELSEDSEERRPSVQVGDPFMEKLLLEACLELYKTDAVVGIQDMGAAGLISSSCEMASRAGSGMELDVSQVPLREPGLTPYEIMLSESQERMLVVPKKGREDEVKKIFKHWGLNARVIGRVTDDGILRIKNGEDVVAEVPAHYLAEAPEYVREGKRPAWLDEENKLDLESLPLPDDYNKVLLEMLDSPNLASKEWIYSQYDHMVQNNTMVLPGSDAAVLRIKGTERAIAVTTDSNGRYFYLDPRQGGKLAVAEAARNIVCSGGQPLAITDGLNFGNPEKEEIYWQFKEAVAGISEACLALGTPVVSGNVSFYNEHEGKAIYPTPIVGMIGVLEKQEYATDIAFKDEGDLVYLIGETREELGGSEYLSVIHDKDRGLPPTLDLEEEKRLQSSLLTLIQEGLVKSAHDCAEGGLTIALTECCLTGDLGAIIELGDFQIRPDAMLFGESASRVLITISPGDKEKAESVLQESGLKYRNIGKTGGNRLIIDSYIDLELTEIKDRWERTIPCHMK